MTAYVPPADHLARDVREALEARLANLERVRWPVTGEPVGRALWGSAAARSPSIVWHSQALEALFEVGHSVDDNAIRPHLGILSGRLDPRCALSPESTPEGNEEFAWVLRTRHVAWVLRCLFPAHGELLAGNEAATAAHRALAQRAFGYLAGDEAAGSPAGWVGIRAGEQFWSEHWRRRRPNLLNTLYAAWAICRATRHGIREERPTWTGAPTPDGAITALIASLRVEPTARGPRVRLRGGWVEPWARRDLPCSVVALIALLMCEYARLLLAASERSNGDHEAASRAFDRARRLGHELISRSDSWTSAIDAFSYAGAEGGWWHIPSYSLCVQAVLETGVAPPQHQAVTAAFETIRRFAVQRCEEDGRSYETWVDPTRPSTAFKAHLPAGAVENWHGSVSLDAIADRGLEPTAGSIHAAAMAWGALRRALRSSDPRTLLPLDEAPRIPESPFDRVIVEPTNNHWTATVSTASRYQERLAIRSGARYLLDATAAATEPLTTGEIARAVARAVPSDVPRATRSEEGVRAAVRGLNRTLGVALLQPRGGDDGTRYRLTANLWFRTEATIEQGQTSVAVEAEWNAGGPNGSWPGHYEVRDDGDGPTGLRPGQALLRVGKSETPIRILPDEAAPARGRFTGKGRPPRLA